MDFPILLRGGPYDAHPAPNMAVEQGQLLAIQNETAWSLYRVRLWGGYCLAEYAGETHEFSEKWIVCTLPEIPF